MTEKTAKVLIVVHGPGRGRRVSTGSALLDTVRYARPDLLDTLVIHRTGDRVPDLRDFNAVIFWLADPLRELYPLCYFDAATIAHEAERLGIRIFNPPAALSNTRKVYQARLWQNAGIPSARAWCVGSATALHEVLGYSERIILRARDQADYSAKLVVSPRDVSSVSFDADCAFTAVEYIDIRREHRAMSAPLGTLYSRFHHKARAFVIGDQVWPSHLFFSKEPIVRMQHCLFEREDRPRRAFARRLGFRTGLLQDIINADRSYFEQPPAHKDILCRAVRLLGLDFAAVDYSFRPDGSIILWEANPYFDLPPGRLSLMAQARDAERRVHETHCWMLTELEALIPISAQVQENAASSTRQSSRPHHFRQEYDIAD